MNQDYGPHVRQNTRLGRAIIGKAAREPAASVANETTSACGWGNKLDLQAQGHGLLCLRLCIRGHHFSQLAKSKESTNEHKFKKISNPIADLPKYMAATVTKSAQDLHYLCPICPSQLSVQAEQLTFWVICTMGSLAGPHAPYTLNDCFYQPLKCIDHAHEEGL
jgi:hypothetical protein